MSNSRHGGMLRSASRVVAWQGATGSRDTEKRSHETTPVGRNEHRPDAPQAQAAATARWLAIIDNDAYAQSKDLPDFVRFLLGTGCRIGESLAVHSEDVDLDRR